MDNWISVTKRLPEIGTNIIVCKDNNHVGEMRYFGYKFQYRQGGGKWLDQTSQITHWQYLPKPPQKVHTQEEINAWDSVD